MWRIKSLNLESTLMNNNVFQPKGHNAGRACSLILLNVLQKTPCKYYCTFSKTWYCIFLGDMHVTLKMNSNPLQRLNNMSISLTEEGFPLGFIGLVPAGKHTHKQTHINKQTMQLQMPVYLYRVQNDTCGYICKPGEN